MMNERHVELTKVARSMGLELTNVGGEHIIRRGGEVLFRTRQRLFLVLIACAKVRRAGGTTRRTRTSSVYYGDQPRLKA